MNTNNQLLVLFASFAWFSSVLEENKDVTPSKKLLKLYRKLKTISMCDNDTLTQRIATINTHIKKLPTKDVDFLLLSVTIIAEYYSQNKQKRLYHPMSWNQMLLLQDEAMENMDTQLWKNTFDYAEAFVKSVLATETTQENHNENV